MFVLKGIRLLSVKPLYKQRPLLTLKFNKRLFLIAVLAPAETTYRRRLKEIQTDTFN